MSNVASVGRPSKASKQNAGRRLASLVVAAVGGAEKVAGNVNAVSALQLIQINFGVDTTPMINPALASALAEDQAAEQEAAAARLRKRNEIIAAGGTPPGRPAAGAQGATQVAAPATQGKGSKSSSAH